MIPSVVWTLAGIYWWLRVILFSLRWIRRVNIGDKVIYEDRECRLIQGVCDPVWELEWDEGPVNPKIPIYTADILPGVITTGGRKVARVHRKDFRKVRSLSNYLGSFQSGYRFYMGYWYTIWVYRGIEPWVKACKIWGGPPA